MSIGKTAKHLGRVLFVAALAAPPLRAQTPAAAPAAAPAPFALAQRVLTAGKPDSAIAILEAYYASNPNATLGWMILGNAYKQKGDPDRALTAFHKAAAQRPTRGVGLFGIATIVAGRGSTDSALAILRTLKSSGAFDMELALTTPEFAALRADPRFAATQFHAEDFVNPFVEKVKVIHEWIGETKGDQFSWIARGIGDVDRDGASDVVTSAPSYGSTAAASRGRVYLYSGKSGRLLWQFTGDSADAVGTGLEGAGDVNGDRIPDVVAGAPGTGRAYVLSGKDGKVLLTLRGTAQEAFGNSTAGAGDQDSDGYADVIVGAPSAGVVGAGAGRVYIFSGKTGSSLLTIDAERAGDAFGSIVAGNRNGTGTPIIVGAPGAGARRTGRVYTFPGTSKRLPPTPGQVVAIGGSAAATPTFVIESDTTGAALGAMFTSLVGDVNGDKVPDVYASDFTNAALGPATGRAYVRSGTDGRVLHTLTGEHAGDAFGIGSADVGDVNKDGYDDLLIGAWQFAGAASSGGKVYLYSGRDGTVLQTITGRVPGETFGFDATGVGDVDGDGIFDFLVTSTWSNIKGYRSGRMFLISGRRQGA